MTATQVPTWTLADRLTKARRMTGMNVSDFADMLGTARNTITNYEKGRTRPSRMALKAYERATGVPLWWLEGEDDQPVTERERRIPCVLLDGLQRAA